VGVRIAHHATWERPRGPVRDAPHSLPERQARATSV
jgi:hypothetical protein